MGRSRESGQRCQRARRAVMEQQRHTVVGTGHEDVKVTTIGEAQERHTPSLGPGPLTTQARVASVPCVPAKPSLGHASPQ